MIIKKCKNLKRKTLIAILFKIGFRRQEKGLRINYIINRRGFSKIGICIAKNKIRGSVGRNVIRRRIRTAYKSYIDKTQFLQRNCIIFFWEKKKIPSLRRIKILLKKILYLR